MSVHEAIHYLPIEELQLSDYNPRVISKHDFEALKRSLRTYGAVQPLVVNMAPGREKIVIGGHQRLRAMKDLGYVQVPCVFRELAETDERQLNLTLNRTQGQFQEDQLAEVLHQMDEAGADLGATGFNARELDRLLHDGFLTTTAEEDNFRFEQAYMDGPTETQPGEILELGPHRLACGSSTDVALVNKLLPGPVDMVFTDPPYNVDYQSKRLGGFLTDGMKPQDFQVFLNDVMRQTIGILKPGGVFYICMGWTGYPALVEALRPCNVHLSSVIIWLKDTVTQCWGDYQSRNEIMVNGKRERSPSLQKGDQLLYGWKQGEHYFVPIKASSDVWYVPRRHKDYIHPSQRPLALITRAIVNSTKKGEKVYDAFGGSGSTIMACEQTGRIGYSCELDPRYCDVIKRRYQAYVSTKPDEGPVPAEVEARQ